jgi:hypothetical protein
VRVTSAPVSNLYFIDNAPSDYTYMVRAIKLEETPRGSYYNLSTGLVAVDLSNPGGGEGWSAADTSDPYRVGLYFAPGSTDHRVDVFDPATGRLVARHDVGTVGADGRTVTFTLSGRQVIRVTNLSGGAATVAGFAVKAAG